MSSDVSYWKNRWEKKDSPWHANCANSYLKKFYNKLNARGLPIRVFVPLCGKTLDMKWLYDLGNTVVGVDGTEQAVVDFFTENLLTYEKRIENGIQYFATPDGRLTIYIADFLNADPTIYGKFDAIWDRGSLVAINSCDVPKYAAVLKHVFADTCSYLISTVDYNQSVFPGPPCSVPVQKIEGLFGETCTTEVLEEIDANSCANADSLIAVIKIKAPHILDSFREIFVLLTHKA